MYSSVILVGHLGRSPRTSVRRDGGPLQVPVLSHRGPDASCHLVSFPVPIRTGLEQETEAGDLLLITGRLESRLLQTEGTPTLLTYIVAEGYRRLAGETQCPAEIASA